MSKHNLPKSTTKNDQLIQIFGEFDVVREALVQIASRLRANVFKDKDGGAIVGSVVPGSLSFLNMPSGVPTSGLGGAACERRVFHVEILDYIVSNVETSPR